MVSYSRFTWITNSSDHRRVWTANLLNTVLPSGLDNYIVYKKLWSKYNSSTTHSQFKTWLKVEVSNKICQYFTISLQKEYLFQEKLLVAASYRKTPVLESLFNSEYCKIFKIPNLKNICVRLLLKMCSWNWGKLKFIRSFNFTLKNRFNQHDIQSKWKCLFLLHEWFPMKFVFTYNIFLVCCEINFTH